MRAGGRRGLLATPRALSVQRVCSSTVRPGTDTVVNRKATRYLHETPLMAEPASWGPNMSQIQPAPPQPCRVSLP